MVNTRLLWLLGVLILIVAPFLNVYPLLLMNMLCFAIFVCAYNLLLGFTGLLSFGHAAYFGLSAYITGWLAKSLGWTPETAILGGVVASVLISILIGAVAIRRQGIYFAMITLAMAQMVYFICLQSPFTGGEDGLQGIPRGKLFGVLPLRDDLTMYFVVLAVFVLVFLLIVRIVQSPFGQILKSIKENEARSISLGYESSYYKLMAFVMSASLAGLAGSLKAIVMGFATLNDVEWHTSGEVILMNLIGGVGTFIGPVIGAFTVIGFQNFLADRVGSLVSVIIGFIFVACVLFFRKGIVGEMVSYLRRKSYAR